MASMTRRTLASAHDLSALLIKMVRLATFVLAFQRSARPARRLPSFSFSLHQAFYAATIDYSYTFLEPTDGHGTQSVEVLSVGNQASLSKQTDPD